VDAPRAPGLAQHLGHGASQSRVTLGLAVTQERSASAAQHPPICAGERIDRNQARVGMTAAKRQHPARRWQPADDRRPAGQWKCGDLQPSRRARRRSPRIPHLIRQLARNEGSLRRMCRYPAFRGELVVGCQHRHSIHADRPRQRSRPGQAVAGTEPSPADVVDDGLCDLREERPISETLEVKVEVPHVPVAPGW